MLAHGGVAPIGRHQQPGLVALAARQGQLYSFLQRHYGRELGRAAQLDLRTGGDPLLQLKARRRQLDHLTQGRQAVFHRRQASLTKMAPIRDVDVGDGGAVGGEARPETVTGQGLAGTR
ncbi:hypothetical protein D3C85_1447060 [compost metagenome]